MLLHRNTCSANRRVYIAAIVIGHDKTSCTFITDSPFSIYGRLLLCLSAAHTHVHTHTNTLTSITTETKLSQINNVERRITQIKA